MSADGAAGEVVRLLTAAGQTLAVAESLTGGAVASAIVDVPGASAVLRGGVVAYATDLKAELLGVPQDLLDAHGAVHPQVAGAMASGVRARLGATWGAATTGVAGPDPQDGRPPGEYHVAVAGPRGVLVRSFAPTGTPTRERVRAAAREAVLALVLDAVRADATGPDDPGGPGARRAAPGTPGTGPAPRALH
ncbi:CinA family protein [Actinotalea fermentans]|uniref:CinA C-terminal domain-containing protein n=1 Tax=Actinotalea fermentans TaxID=43671 RepID=A0A511YVR6_9CELL|nr:CinA family protein [Actinotalea fermentans]KGM14985.1 hypothetical protein N867_13200 [Actinotalea fermentans ATCC 43279 = JCM 9966 = DSM 3133]GEN79291.1 hypothetical protein AFE02nite_10250 [Actinotalea fermentans]